MPLIETKGAASAQGFGEFAKTSVATYIEDVFSTYLYTGNGSTQTITNGIDLAGKGGLVWIKARTAAESHSLYDTSRGANWQLQTNSTAAQQKNDPNSPWFSDYSVSSFNAAGFSLGAYYSVNGSTLPEVSWTFRKQPKFFDVVTYTGNGQNGRQISHNLGSTPGCIIVKCLNFTGSGGPSNWLVYHQSVGTTKNLYLNTTAAAFTSNGEFGTPTSTYFVVNQPGGGDTLNANGDQYVAYIFAHNAGGFGLTGTDNVISCGSYTGNGSATGPTITLGYEPQWLLIKRTTGASSWLIVDVMRGWDMSSADAVLQPNATDAEYASFDYGNPTSTGFQINGTSTDRNGSGETYIYIAIRRGPMKVPTSGTSVYNAIAYTGNDASNRQITGLGFPPDLALVKATTQVRNYGWEDRLRGADQWLVSSGTDSESSYSGLGAGGPLLQNGITVGANGLTNEAPNPYILQAMRRAPSFFDEVCYTGTGNAMTVNHNLGVTPELMIVKGRSGATGWVVYTAPTGATKYMRLDNTNAAATLTAVWNDTSPTSSVFTVGSNSSVNTASATYVTYLFATCAGVSKVGSYTGNGTTQTINCGFTGGARFVLIKRTDSTGDWYVYDTARGMTVLTDPYLLMNSTAAETATLGSVTTVSTGFAVNASILAAINTNAASYIFLAIA